MRSFGIGCWIGSGEQDVILEKKQDKKKISNNTLC